MKKTNFYRAAAVALAAATIVGFTACSAQNTANTASAAAAAASTQTTVYGKVTAISGSKITLALGTLNQQSGRQAPNANGGTASGSSNNQQGTPPNGGQAPSTGGTNNQQGTPPNGGQAPSASGTVSGGSNNQQGTPPSNGQGTNMLTLNGKTQTITISDTGILKKQSAPSGGQPAGTSGTAAAASSSASATVSASASASLSDITVGSILKVTYNGSADNLASVEILSAMGGGTAMGGTSGGNTTEVAGTGVYTLTSGSASKNDTTLTAVNQNQSASIVSGGAKLTLSNTKIVTSGNTSSMDSSSFFGTNAGVLVKKGSTATISGGSISTTGTGANGVFAYGENAAANVNSTTITCTASGAHGVDATYGGTVTMKNVNISTAGNGASAAIATDRGGGTITAEGGTVVTTGTKSPAIYSTGKITVSNATLKSTGSQAVVVEGKNSATVNDCSISTTKSNGVFIYQSMSGDADVGSGTFTMNGGSLTVGEGPIFYSTNTTAVISLKNAAITGSSGVLLKAAADQWGTTGSNGSAVTLNADAQKLSGSIVLDKVSSAVINLKNGSSLTSTVNSAKTAKSVSILLDSTSTWNVTGTSYLTSITDADSTLSNIKSNGNTVYYDASNSANSWLNGKTITLAGGGKLTPAK